MIAAFENNGQVSADGFSLTTVNTDTANELLSNDTEKVQQYLKDNGLENACS